ncbi:MAG: hypothetical protein H7Y12_02090 [Sphingobacteriaceae bacterium]|nr:hypothetical protein [Cytophagaceae bacterium]
MKKFALLLALTLTSCREKETADPKSLDFGEFQLSAPDTWRAFSRQGIDSKVGGITDGRDTLVYDYGWYSYDLRQQTAATHQRTTTTLDGRNALIVQPLQKGKGTIGVYVEVDGQNRFNLLGNNIQDEETVVRIFRSVTFK